MTIAAVIGIQQPWNALSVNPSLAWPRSGFDAGAIYTEPYHRNVKHPEKLTGNMMRLGSS